MQAVTPEAATLATRQATQRYAKCIEASKQALAPILALACR